MVAIACKAETSASIKIKAADEGAGFLQSMGKDCGPEQNRTAI